MNGLISDAWAQAAPGAPSQFTPLLMVAVFFVIFYFLLFRPAAEAGQGTPEPHLQAGDRR